MSSLERGTLPSVSVPRQPEIHVERIYGYQPPASAAAALVDRLWPRGLRKDGLTGVRWLKDVAPSPHLRTWYGHQPERFDEFRDRYRSELSAGEARRAFEQLRALALAGPLILLTATRDVEHSQAAVLAELLRTNTDPSAGP